jgi:hypothetical protein
MSEEQAQTSRDSRLCRILTAPVVSGSTLRDHTGAIGSFVRIADSVTPKHATICAIARLSPSHAMLTER